MTAKDPAQGHLPFRFVLTLAQALHGLHGTVRETIVKLAGHRGDEGETTVAELRQNYRGDRSAPIFSWSYKRDMGPKQ